MPTSPIPSLQQDLANQQAESTRLEALYESLKKELFEMSQHYLRSGWHAGFDDYYTQRREVYAKFVYAERDLERSNNEGMLLEQRIEQALVEVAA